jgi:hypothetical protein
VTGSTPDLDPTRRYAQCSCGKVEPSDPERLFCLIARGDGSRSALEHCRNCGYTNVAHEPPRPGVIRSTVARVCDTFEPHGAYDYDTFYCGCRGWD